MSQRDENAIQQDDEASYSSDECEENTPHRDDWRVTEEGSGQKKKAKTARANASLGLPIEIWNLVVMFGRESKHWLCIIPSLMSTSKLFYALTVQNTSAARLSNSIALEPSQPAIAPIVREGIYCYEEHKSAERERARRDVALATFLLNQPRENDVKRNVSVYTLFGGLQIHLIYHPNPEFSPPKGLTWINTPASGKLYKRVTCNRIQWHSNVLRGDILPFMLEFFEDELRDGRWMAHLANFTRRTAFFMKKYPHENYATYGSYTDQFVAMLRSVEPGTKTEQWSIALREMKEQLTGQIAMAGRPGDMERYEEIMNRSTRPSVSECSRRVHRVWVE